MDTTPIDIDVGQRDGINFLIWHSLSTRIHIRMYIDEVESL